MTIAERFLGYVAYPTMSDEASESCPSTQKQLALAKHLVESINEIGVRHQAPLHAFVDEYGYVYATLEKNTDKKAKTIGLIAHMDTSDACPDSPICPKTVLFTGEDIVLNEAEGIVLSPKEYPAMLSCLGKHLIVTDGKTLLGADDKAGIAEIVTALETLIVSGREHGTVKVAFTPDEEIGRGADLFDVKGFGADYAYTLDGGALPELEYENFNAASAKVTVYGRSIHPGSAKGKMINASTVLCEFNAMLPPEDVPEKTEGYQGFFHMTDIEGTCERATAHYIIRDHDKRKFEQRKARMQKLATVLCAVYGEGSVVVEIEDSYYNMLEVMEEHMYVIDAAKAAFHKHGYEAHCVPIRGGTDGARLSFEGLPCPNLPTGGENYHSRFEYVCVEDMQTMADIIVTMLCDAVK